MAAQSDSQTFDQATSIVCASHLHQKFWIETEVQGRIRVTFATTSNFSDTSLPTVLLCPPMFGGRWMLLHFYHLAKSHGLRMICADRPGMGGSTLVPLEHRMKVWLETIPALLKHLGVEHVSLLSHSAGTLYALNAMYYLRDILYPEHPYVALIAPWVPNVHSNAALMNLASKVPVPILDSWHNVMRFVAQKVQPAVAWSGGVTTAVTGLFGSSDDSESDAALVAKFGTSAEVGRKIEKIATKYCFAEDMRAGTEEAKLCLRKGGPDSWMICDDYKNYVHSLAQKEKDAASSDPAHHKLKIRVFYAESDIMIAEGGKKYFDECWKVPDVLEQVNFESETLPGTDHETASVDVDKGAVRTIFEEIKAAFAS